MEQQEPDPDEREAGQMDCGCARCPLPHRVLRQGIQERPGACVAGEKARAEQEHGTHEEQHEVRDEDLPGQIDVLREEVVEDRGAADAGDPDHADAVHRHELVEPVRRNVDEAGLAEAHDEPEDHHQRDDDAHGCKVDPDPGLRAAVVDDGGGGGHQRVSFTSREASMEW